MTDPIDRVHLAEMTGDDDEFAEELIAEFIKATEDILVDLRSAIERGDAEAVRVSFHAIKGSALSVGAMAIGETCKSIEDRARGGDLSGMGADLESVIKDFGAVKEFHGK